LTFQERLPVEAIRAAAAGRMAAVPIFVHAIEQYLSSSGNLSAKDAHFFIFHLVGEQLKSIQYLAALSPRPLIESWLPFSKEIPSLSTT